MDCSFAIFVSWDFFVNERMEQRNKLSYNLCEAMKDSGGRRLWLKCFFFFSVQHESLIFRCCHCNGPLMDSYIVKDGKQYCLGTLSSLE